MDLWAVVALPQRLLGTPENFLRAASSTEELRVSGSTEAEVRACREDFVGGGGA